MVGGKNLELNKTGDETMAVAMMFHANEVDSVEDHGDTATAVIVTE